MQRRKTSTRTSLFAVQKITSEGIASCYESSIVDLVKGSSIHARDLFSLDLTSVEERKIDESLLLGNKHRFKKRWRTKFKDKNITPVILPRGEKIVISFGQIRAIIDKDEGMILDAHDPYVKMFAEDLKELFCLREQIETLSSSKEKEPFEIVFMEEILKEACETWNHRILLYEPIVEELLLKVSSETYSESGVQRIMPIKYTLQHFEMELQQSLDCLTTLLNDDDDMVSLLLTEQAKERSVGKEVDIRRHFSVELLLEEYSRQLKHILQGIQHLIRMVDSQQDLTRISLDTYRNRMIRTNVFLSVVSVALGTSTTIAGLFGMNLISGIETHPHAFMIVTYSTTGLALFVTLFSSWYMSTNRTRKYAELKFQEMKTIENSLKDAQSLDFIVKVLLRSEENLNIEDFEKLIKKSGMSVSRDEVNFLFDIMDKSKNGLLRLEEDLPKIKNSKLLQ